MPLRYLVVGVWPSLLTMLPKGWLTVAMLPLVVAPESSLMNSRALMAGSLGVVSQSSVQIHVRSDDCVC